jgi:hypothetical protein
LRAGLADRPEDYRWNSLGCHIQTQNKDQFLSTDFGLKEFNVKSQKERIKRYRQYVYEAGAIGQPDKMQAKIIDDKAVAKERRKILKSAASIGLDTVPVILRIPASLDQRSSWLKSTSALSIYFIQSMKKNQSQSRDWMGCIH